MLQQKVALVGIFEGDLLQMTDKLIHAATAGPKAGPAMAADLASLQKLIAVSFQAMKSSMGSAGMRSDLAGSSSQSQSSARSVASVSGGKYPVSNLTA